MLRRIARRTPRCAGAGTLPAARAAIRDLLVARPALSPAVRRAVDEHARAGSPRRTRGHPSTPEAGISALRELLSRSCPKFPRGHSCGRPALKSARRLALEVGIIATLCRGRSECRARPNWRRSPTPSVRRPTFGWTLDDDVLFVEVHASSRDDPPKVLADNGDDASGMPINRLDGHSSSLRSPVLHFEDSRLWHSTGYGSQRAGRRGWPRPLIRAVREINEDSLSRANAFVVADGMGGHAAGDVASRTALDVMSRLDEAPSAPVHCARRWRRLIGPWSTMGARTQARAAWARPLPVWRSWTSAEPHTGRSSASVTPGSIGSQKGRCARSPWTIPKFRNSWLRAC